MDKIAQVTYVMVTFKLHKSLGSTFPITWLELGNICYKQF